MSISGSVGAGGVNAPADVNFVQSLLNIARGQSGLAPIAVDGLNGPQTIGAIQAFQAAETGIVDGRVDPGGPAITRLEEIGSTAFQATIREVGLQLFAILRAQMFLRQATLPVAVATQVSEIEAELAGYDVGPPIVGLDFDVLQLFYPEASGVPQLLAAAAAAAPAAGAAAAEALMLALLVTIALLIVIMSLPHTTRAIEDLILKIQRLFAKVLDLVNDAVAGVDDIVRRNTQAGMLCSEALLLFRQLTREVTDGLTAPRNPDPVLQQQHVIRTSNLFKRWQQALIDLLVCLTANGAT